MTFSTTHSLPNWSRGCPYILLHCGVSLTVGQDPAHPSRAINRGDHWEASLLRWRSFEQARHRWDRACHRQLRRCFSAFWSHLLLCRGKHHRFHCMRIAVQTPASLRAGNHWRARMWFSLFWSVHPEVSARPPPAFAADNCWLVSALRVFCYFSSRDGKLFGHSSSTSWAGISQLTSKDLSSHLHQWTLKRVVENTCGWVAHSTTQRDERIAGSTSQVLQNITEDRCTGKK